MEVVEAFAGTRTVVAVVRSLKYCLAVVEVTGKVYDDTSGL